MVVRVMGHVHRLSDEPTRSLMWHHRQAGLATRVSWTRIIWRKTHPCNKTNADAT